MGALAKPSKKLKPGDVVTAEGLAVEMGEDLGDGRRVVRLDPGDADLHDRLAKVGLPPLPPYIANQIDDPSRYQTVYADRPLSAAAPLLACTSPRPSSRRCGRTASPWRPWNSPSASTRSVR